MGIGLFIKVCYRTICYHPFLVGMLCFVSFLYTSFPVLFSLLVSVSPVLVCAALLLGTLLSYGQPNIPHFERNDKPSDDIVPLETSTGVERYVDQERDKVDQSTDKLSEAHRGQRFGDQSPLVAGVSREVAKGFHEQKDEEKNGDASEYSLTSKLEDESVDFENDKSVDSFDSRRVNVDSPPGSLWKQREEYSEALDSGSDGAESSSPDASIADIIPMLDELHPLLDEDTPQPVDLSRDISHAASASESSSKSSESDDESDDGSEEQDELEVGDDENDEGEDEEETQDKEDPKSAITWTEEDQKNLMDLGRTELERNQRLESLIARRRSRKNMSIDEKNLIDLVTSDSAENVPPISTARHNPFDLPNDNYDPGLLPIPGSAPSILLPSRNPFDLPYDPGEEKPNLTEDTFQQEFIISQPKEQSFRRHESFSVGPSIFGLNKLDKKDIRLRPYFVPDVMASEGTSYSPFQRQASDLSDSKVSSVLETESQGSIEDLEDKNPTEEDLEDKNLNEELESKNLTDERIFKEPELISKIEPSEDVGHGSQSSEEAESLVLGADDKRDIELVDTDVKLQNVENHREVGKILFHGETAATSVVLDTSKVGSKSETSEQKCSSQSSSSSSSEVSERIFADKEVIRLSSEEAMSHVDSISGQPSPSGSDLNITISSADESSNLEPIYDASPPSIKKNTSSSSIASDMLPESEMTVPPELVKRTVSFREPVENKQDKEKFISANEQTFSSVDSQELQSREEVMDRYEYDVEKLETCKHDEVIGSASASSVPVLDNQAPVNSKSSTNEPPASSFVSNKEGSTGESLKVSKIQVPSIIKSSTGLECVLEQPNAKVATEESKNIKNGIVHKVSTLKDNNEPRPTADVDLNHKHLPEGNAAHASKDKGASLDLQNVTTDSDVKQNLKNQIEKPNTSLQQGSETGPSEASFSKDSKLSDKESILSEKSEADAGKVDHKVVTQEEKATTTEKPDHAVHLPQQTGLVTGDGEGKKKEKPQKVCPSSSLSDSDRE